MTARFQLMRACAFAAAAGGALWAATEIANEVEIRSEDEVRAALAEDGLDDLIVAADGLQLLLVGEVANESDRFQAITAAARIVDPDRIVDELDIAAAKALEPLRFSIEILRNVDGVSLIGLIPEATGRARFVEALSDEATFGTVTDMLDVADHPVPQDWVPAVDFAIAALTDLTRAKISVTPGVVTITASTGSAEERERLERLLTAAAPSTVEVVMDINAPLPVVRPFAFRFVQDETGARLEACTSASETGRDTILAAVRTAGVPEDATCRLGLGTPSSKWADTIAMSVDAVAEIGGGTLNISNSSITYIAPDSASPDRVDDVMARLQGELPAIFSLQTVVPAPVDDAGAPVAPTAEFMSTLSPEGLVQLRGYVRDESRQRVVQNFAEALFGASNVYSATRLAPDVPEGWSIRVLAGLEALSQLERGSLVVRENNVMVAGASGDPGASVTVSGLLSQKLGETEDVRLAIQYDETLDPVAQLPTPQECAERVGSILSDRQIAFDPGSAVISEDGHVTLDRIAEALSDCSEVRMEIAGHTDSQGREQMNLNLSQSRAEAVLAAIMDRRVVTRNLAAKGYGESQPIADNKTEEGREANRRIEFTLLDASGQPIIAEDTADEAAEEAGTPQEDGVETASDDASEAGEEETDEADEQN